MNVNEEKDRKDELTVFKGDEFHKGRTIMIFSVSNP